jgi:hypothetical protein
MTEGGIASWKLKEGDTFTAGDVLVEIETDKATIDVEAQDDGFLAKIIVSANERPQVVNELEGGRQWSNGDGSGRIEKGTDGGRELCPIEMERRPENMAWKGQGPERPGLGLVFGQSTGKPSGWS